MLRVLARVSGPRNRVQVTSGSTITFGPYRLESGPDRLFRGSEEIALRPKSLGVLAYLARRPGRLVSKEELREQVWDAAHVSDATLRGTVLEIRAALGDDQKSPGYLETVPARGYRFLLGPETISGFEGEKGPRPDFAWHDEEQPIVGRQREVEYLLNRLLQASKGQRQLVFIAGEPGIGKTTLVELFLKRLAGRPRTTCVSGQCVMSFGAGEAYGPVLEALGRLGQAPGGDGLIRVLARCAPMWLVQLPVLVEAAELERLQRQVQGATRERMVRELHDALERLTAEATLVLVLEDVHWSDVATVELLVAIAHRPEPARLLILATYRPAEAVVHAPALRDAMRALDGHGLCEQLDLELLTQSDVASYVAARLDGPSSDEMAALIFERSDGNALFMVNVLEHLVRARAVRRHDDRWVVDDSAAALTQMPEGLRSFLRRRLDDLSAEERQTVEAASVVGVEFAAAAVAAGLARPDDRQDLERVETGLESLASRGPLVAPSGVAEWPDGTLSERYRFRHALYREELYDQIPEARRARLHERVGERLQAAYGPRSPELAAVLAVHYEEGRDPENAAWYHRLAGEQALGRHAYHEAARNLRAALGALEKLLSPRNETSRRTGDGASKLDDRLRWELDVCTALGTTLIATRGYADPEVKRVHLRARVLCGQLTDPAQKLPTLYNLWAFHLVAGELREGRDLVVRMSELTAEAEDDELRLVSSSARAQDDCFLGELASSGEAIRDVLAGYDPQRHGDLARRYGQEDPGVTCLGLDAMRLWLTGSPDQAVVRSREALTLAERLDQPSCVALARAFSLLAHQFRRDAPAVRRQGEALEALATKQGFEHWVAWSTIFLGAAHASAFDEFVAQPALADARLADHADDLSLAGIGPVERVLQHLQLLAAAHEAAEAACPRPIEPCARCTDVFELEQTDGTLHPLHLGQAEVTQPEVALHQARGLATHAHATRRGEVLDARRQSDDVSLRRVVHAQIVADLAHHHLAGVEAHANREVVTLPPQFVRVLLDCAAQSQRCEAGSLGVIFMGERGAEQRHHSVAGVLVDRPFETVDALGEDLEEAVEDAVPLLRVDLLRDVHRPLHVGKEHRYLLALSFQHVALVKDALGEVTGRVVTRRPHRRRYRAGGLGILQPRTAPAAKREARRSLAAALGARSRQRSTAASAKAHPGRVLEAAGRAVHPRSIP